MFDIKHSKQKTWGQRWPCTLVSHLPHTVLNGIPHRGRYWSDQLKAYVQQHYRCMATDVITKCHVVPMSTQATVV
jgi:hypothetical protein